MSPKDFFLLLRILRTKLSSYSTELAILFLSFIVTIWVVSLIDLYQFPQKLNFIKREDYWPLNFGFVRAIVWIIFFLFFIWLWNILRQRNKSGNYTFKLRDWPDYWIIQGGSTVESNPPRLLIQMSESGCLLKKKLWKNFEMKFQMKFLMDEFKNDTRYTTRFLGILFRALNLDSYFMLEIIVDDNGKLYAKPHVRYLGDWEIIDFVHLCKVDTNTFIKIGLDVKDEIVTLSINGELFYQWILPTHVDINYKVSKGGQDQGNTDKIDKLLSKEKLGDSYIIPEIPFRNNFGMVGFRAYPGQGATIKGLTVKPL